MTQPPDDGLVDTEQAATILEVPSSLIMVWKARGRIVPHSIARGRGPKRGSPIYVLDELRPLADAYHQRATRHTQKG